MEKLNSLQILKNKNIFKTNKYSSLNAYNILEFLLPNGEGRWCVNKRYKQKTSGHGLGPH